MSTSARNQKRFDDLQARLASVWSHVRSSDAGNYTSVVVPSLSFDQEELSKIEGVSFYEERLLFTLIRLRDPRARLIYVTSQPIHNEIIDYYLQLLPGVPISHARRRLNLVCVYDARPQPLSQKILDRPRVLARLKTWIGDKRMAYLTTFNSTILEQRLAVELGIPLNNVDPRLLDCGTKSGSRRVFAEAGIEHPLGFNDLRNRADVAGALYELRRQRPGLPRAVIKLNESFAGAGNALFEYPEVVDEASIERALDRLAFSVEGEGHEHFLGKFQECGGIVEEWAIGRDLHSPSVQVRVDPPGVVSVISSHDQVLGGPTGQSFMGARFPARSEYRDLIQERALRVGKILRDRGVRGRFGVDFIVFRAEDNSWDCRAIEINLRMGGTTHPFMALEFLTSGHLDQESGEFVTADGEKKYYFATDHVKSPSYRGLLPEDFIEILTEHGLQFKPRTETGVLFHMIGALSQYGKFGMTCIGDSHEQANELYHQSLQILDDATGRSGRRRPHLVQLFDKPVVPME